MRKVILAMQVSLDGYVEGPNGEMDWMIFDDKEQWQSLFSTLKNVDTFLLGRVMYPDYEKYWSAVLEKPSSYQNNEVEYAQLAVKTPHLVFSNTLEKAEWDNTRIVRGDIKDEVLKLKQQPGKDIILLGGAKLASTFINLGLIDEFWLRVNQTIVGGGKQLFNNLHDRTNLKLESAAAFKSGVVELHYIKI